MTSPLLGSFRAFEQRSGIAVEALGTAMAAITERTGRQPLFELETGRLSEADFLADLSAEVSVTLGREVSMDGFGAAYFEALAPNEPLLAYLRELRRRGYRMALCTNNVREWEPRWRAMLPVDEVFEVVVDSSAVGVRKPEPRIYEITLERLGVSAPAAVLVDDIELNCQAARELGLRAVWFRDTEQAVAEIEAALGGCEAPAR